ncbi:hypothetical protein GCM10011494_21730 [Novosphingobium endophyticum]|uniref:DUF1214 domain-containing protein n=1 Tax=Novosphingobium endophyticum TaxID=1955250 RepID=A0A916X5S2_9SPHN|nr:hypothetical protein [Novosphingobium endophyticum]GGC02881.1 hypothetical protein GCM10011494_21730 [Novosphingobium endophyticum]
MTHDAEGYFLSSTNPVANVDQRDLEKLAIRMFERDDVKAARLRADIMWRRVADRLMPADQMALLDDHVSDYCFRCTMVAANTDANHPRVLRVYTQGAEWFGHKVPGSKWGGDNPDNAYRIIPVVAGGSYEVIGQRQVEPSTYVTFQLVGNSTTSATLASLEQMDMEIAADGSYRLTLDDTPADGRRNHMTIPEGTLYLFIRDSMGDWETQAPDALRVRRLNPATRVPLSEDELAKTAIHNILSDVFYALYAQRLFFNGPQMLTPPEGAGSVGGLLTQQGSLGHFTLAEDEAIVITANAAGATYRDIVLHDLWLRSLPNRDNQISLTNAQMMPDADGRYTYVIAIADPGVHNWLDTCGLHDVLVLHRWQGFPDPDAPPPAIESRRVKLAELDAALQQGVARVTVEERATQIARRQAAYDRRFAVDDDIWGSGQG